MDNLSGTNPFLDHFLHDPLEVFKNEQRSSNPRHDEPFLLSPTIQASCDKNPARVETAYYRNHSMNELELVMLAPENLKVTVGKYTFALLSHLKIGVR